MKVFTATFAALVLVVYSVVSAGQVQVFVEDKTPNRPLSKPSPVSYGPRYISGFGSGDSFTVFFEDRDNDSTINYVSTIAGPSGFPPAATPTNIKDTHFCIKDWPITVGGTIYDYRAWGAVGNNNLHKFYVSNDLANWELVSTFTIPKSSGVPGGYVYYGFHDVVYINGTYYAWGECNIGYTLMCRSSNGADDWEAFDCVGGIHDLVNVGPLGLVGPQGPTPTGSFFELGDNRGYGKIMVPCDDSAFYLAVNTVAKPSLPPGELEAAFINPANWTWHDGTTGLAGTPILSANGHDCKECWVVPNGRYEWIILYDGDFGENGGYALGYAIMTIPPSEIEVLIDIDPDTLNLKSNGRWITCYIDIPQNYGLNDIDIVSIRLVVDDYEVEAEFGGYNNNVLMVKFPRSEVQQILVPGRIELTVIGEFTDGIAFEGTDWMRVINPGKKK